MWYARIVASRTPDIFIGAKGRSPELSMRLAQFGAEGSAASADTSRHGYASVKSAL